MHLLTQKFNNMKNLIWLIVMFVFLRADAQQPNLHHHYQQWNTSNFRNCSAFQKRVNLKVIDYRLLGAAIFWVSNEMRASNDRSELIYSDPLETAAFLHARYMATQRVLSHENAQDRKRKTAQDRARLAGVENPFIAENVLFNSHFSEPLSYLELADKIVGIWMKSPPHRKNMLSESAFNLGCGVYINEDEIYASQSFQFYEPVQVDLRKVKDRFPE
jgi:uncharacterized protein YkwD